MSPVKRKKVFQLLVQVRQVKGLFHKKSGAQFLRFIKMSGIEVAGKNNDWDLFVLGKLPDADQYILATYPRHAPVEEHNFCNGISIIISHSHERSICVFLVYQFYLLTAFNQG